MNCLSIGADSLSFCNYFDVINNYNGSDIVETLINKRNYYISLMKNGNPPHICKACINLEKKDWIIPDKINYIYIRNRTFCSCDCIYCYISDFGNKKTKIKRNKIKTYSLKTLLFSLEKHNVLSNDAHFVISGGNPEEFPKDELEYIIDFATFGERNAEIRTAGIKYSKVIEKKLLEKQNLSLNISLDSGTKELYKYIKRIDAFDDVIKNLYKYFNVSSNIVLKYIIIPTVNDNIDEIEKFLDICYFFNCTRIEFEIENLYVALNKPITKKLHNLLLFIIQKKNCYFVNNILLNISINTNAKIYNEKIEFLLKNANVILKIQYSSSTDKTIVNNINKYILLSKNNSNLKIVFQYIVTNELLNNKQYNLDFLNFCKQLNINNIYLVIQKKYKEKIEKEYFYSFIKTFNNENINVSVSEEFENTLK